MVFYLTLFFAFLYFKIARVHKKEEGRSSSGLKQHFFVGIAITSLLVYGFLYQNLYLFIPVFFLFAIMASLVVTAIQLGIFVNGKPLFGLTHIYRYLPHLRIGIFLLSAFLWAIALT